MDREILESRVDAGIMLLNQDYPGWYKEIDLDELNIASCFDCTLGQLFQGFDRGIQKLFGLEIYDDMTQEPTEHGFSAYQEPFLSPDESQRRLDTLTEIWKEKITALQEPNKELDKICFGG